MTLELPIDSWKENPERLLKQAYNANLDWCVSYVIKNNGMAADAEDVFQESICTAWIKLTEGKFEGTSDQFNAYIRQICKYKWINQLRQAASHPLELRDDLSDFSGRVGQDPLDFESEKSDLLLNSFADLGEKCKDLLSRFYYKKEPLATIAKIRETTEESIKTMKYRCMMQLRKAYLERAKDNE